MNGWIGVDLDGTLAVYGKWDGHNIIGAPVIAMVERVQRWLEEGKVVKIFTARVSREDQAAEAREAIERWCEQHIGQVLEVTCQKDYAMYELWDDRAVCVRKNTGQMMCPSPANLEEYDGY